MIFTQESEYSAVLDACVLVPVSLCDILLRLAEEPAMYRPLWSEEIMAEMAKALRTKLHRTAAEITYRRQQMNHAFPEAMAAVPPELVDAVELPDRDDRHVLAAAIKGQANMIVTQNVKHFPKICLEKWGLLCQTADEFLIDQYHLSPQTMLDKLDDQAAGISQDRGFVISSLRNAAPKFAKLLEERF
jgi:predicted nucleic acid-binding protein